MNITRTLYSTYMFMRFWYYKVWKNIAVHQGTPPSPLSSLSKSNTPPVVWLESVQLEKGYRVVRVSFKRQAMTGIPSLTRHFLSTRPGPATSILGEWISFFFFGSTLSILQGTLRKLPSYFFPSPTTDWRKRANNPAISCWFRLHGVPFSHLQFVPPDPPLPIHVCFNEIQRVRAVSDSAYHVLRARGLVPSGPAVRTRPLAYSANRPPASPLLSSCAAARVFWLD